MTSGTTVYIVSGCRTPIGSFQGQLRNHNASEMGTIVIKEVLNRASINPKDIDEVIMGQILTAGQGQNPARQASVKAGIPYSVPAFTINMLCGSGLKAVYLAYNSIRNHDANIIIAGGQESMSRAQHTSFLRGTKLGPISFADTLIMDGLTDAFNNIHMGNTAELLAAKYNITRTEQDQFAYDSQMKCDSAVKAGNFLKEIIPIMCKSVSIECDEFPKPNCTLIDLAKLRPAFQKEGSVTAGNSSGINDGAAAVLLMSEEQIQIRNIKPMAKIIAFAQVGIDPQLMGLGPIEAVHNVIKKANWTMDDVDLFELNEAFAVQSIICIEKLGVNMDKVNINGGAIALGHPIGASGTRILITLLYNLERLNKIKGVAALCVGGGMGIAIAVERCTS